MAVETAAVLMAPEIECPGTSPGNMGFSHDVTYVDIVVSSWLWVQPQPGTTSITLLALNVPSELL